MGTAKSKSVPPTREEYSYALANGQLRIRIGDELHPLRDGPQTKDAQMFLQDCTLRPHEGFFMDLMGWMFYQDQSGDNLSVVIATATDCLGGCGFTGSASNGGYCSMCTQDPGARTCIFPTVPTTGHRIDSQNWFAHLFGFSEEGFNMGAVRDRFALSGTTLTSRVNGASYGVGEFSCPSLAELHAHAARIGALNQDPTTVVHTASCDVFELHSDPMYSNAMFMAASQFNALEFSSPGGTPEDGVTNYISDGTQGPACALATGPATVVRNYFAGQSAKHQINNLSDTLHAVGGVSLVDVRNGYTNSDAQRLGLLRDRLRDPAVREAGTAALRIGLHSGVEVPWARGESRFVLAPKHKRQLVTQSYCSALACGYTSCPAEDWAPLATLVLDASYEATLLSAAIEKMEGRGSGIVLLTFLGGGVFGNKPEWIHNAIGRAVARCATAGLRVVVVHFRSVDAGRVQGIKSAMQAHGFRF
jgi:hypothetical protein